MQRTRFLFGAVLAVLFSLLAGCAQLGLEKPQGPEDNLRYAQATLTGIYRTIGDNVISGAMSPTEQRSVLSRVRPAYDALTEADRLLRLGRGSAPEFTDKIALARMVLTEVRNLLVARYPASQIPLPTGAAAKPVVWHRVDHGAQA